MKFARSPILCALLLVGCGSAAEANAPQEAARVEAAASTAPIQSASATAPAPSSAPLASASAVVAPPAPPDSAPKPLLVKSGIIELGYSAMPETTDTVYFDDFGAREAKYSKMEMHIAGQPTLTSTEVTIVADGTITSFDLDTKKGTRRKLTADADLIERALTEEEIAAFTPEDIAAMHFKRLPSKTFGGKEALGCVRFEKPAILSQWGYRGILLRSEI